MDTPPKRPRGRPRKDPTGIVQTQPIKLTPTEAQFLRELGGSVNAGMRLLVERAMAQPEKQPG